MPQAIYDANTEAAVQLAGAAAKTVIGVRAHASLALMLKDVSMSFDGVSATAVPVLIELMHATFATNGPGTNSTSVTPQQRSGRTFGVGATAARNWTAEPTTLTLRREWTLSPNGGTLFYPWPLGDEPDCGVNEGLVLRMTAPATASGVNVRAGMGFCRL